MTTPRPVRIALQLQPQHADYATIREAALEAETLGVDVLFNWDHFFPLDGAPDGLHFECWTMLASLAEMTSRVEVGALVTCNSYRNPDLLTDMARTVDHISGGRLILGVGSGWFKRDYEEYGYLFGSAGERIDELAGALPRIESRLARVNPPALRDIPVLVGGGGERKTLRLAAKHADIWHSFGDVGTIKHKMEVLWDHCAMVGRNPNNIEVSAAVAGGPSPAGSPEELGASLRALGVSLFTVGVSGPHYDLDLLREWVDWREDQNSVCT